MRIFNGSRRSLSHRPLRAACLCDGGRCRWQGILLEARAFALVSIASGCALLWLYSANPQQLVLSEIMKGFEARQRVNLQQVYPFGYQQRRSDFNGDPWTQGAELMERDFGRKDPKLGEAIARDQKAFLEHVRWNLSLVPAGLQFGIFSHYAGTITPDFGAMKGGSKMAGYLFAVVVSVALTGAL